MMWEQAILEVFELKEGIVTLGDLYKAVPNFINKTKSSNIPHTIRAYLRRLKQKGLIKQIGLSQYALTNIDYQVHFYEDIKEDTVFNDFLSIIPRNQLHTYIEGMLIEIGSFSGYKTYSADSYKIFNGKKLNELTDYNIIPKFTYDRILNDVKEIDVIWFRKGFPVKTFDVENSTRFSMAFQRIFELRAFKTSFYMVANSSKKTDYINKSNKKIFEEIKGDTKFVSYIEVFELYKNAVISNRILRNCNIL